MRVRCERSPTLGPQGRADSPVPDGGAVPDGVAGTAILNRGLESDFWVGEHPVLLEVAAEGMAHTRLRVSLIDISFEHR